MSSRWRGRPTIGFDTFVISAPTPFVPADCEELIVDAPSVVARYFPDYARLYARKGWTMFRSIDRVYDASRARQRLGFVCRTSFADVLAGLARRAVLIVGDLAVGWDGRGSLSQRRRQIAIAGGAPLIGEAEQLGGILGDAVEFGIVGLGEIDDLLVVAEKVLDELGMAVEARAAS